MIKIHFSYRHIDKPWGGANNFIRILNQGLCDIENFCLTRDFDDPCDILFMNQLSAGPGSDFKNWHLSTIRRRLGDSRFINRWQCPMLAVRAVNLCRNVDIDCGIRTRLLGYLQDCKIIELLNMADLAIFQSHYQKDVFVKAGYRGRRSLIIYNSFDDAFYDDTPKYVEYDGVLKLIATSFSIRSIKRHDLIAQFSMLPNVEVTFVGNWPAGLKRRKVNIRGVLNSAQIKDLMRENHYFLHPAIRDACPNSILEALAVGLPVIFNPEPGGSAELVQDAGLALIEDDLITTADFARKELSYRRACALRRRNIFRLNIAMDQYTDAFRQLLQINGA
jgi:glycosyltransferase involved in cell wall biosynthesis